MIKVKTKSAQKQQSFKIPGIKKIFPIFHSNPPHRKEVSSERGTFTSEKEKVRAEKTVWSSGDVENIPQRVVLHPSLLDSEIITFKSGPDCGVDYVESFFNKKKVEYEKIKYKHKQRYSFEKNYEILEHKVGCFSVSLYERNPLNGRLSGEPIADSYLVCSRGNTSILLVADGVNWGRQAKLASRCAIYACYRHLENCLFHQFRQDAKENTTFTTADIFKWLYDSFASAQSLILLSETPGLTTLCAAVVIPAASDPQGKVKSPHYVVCALNIGDSLAFLLSKFYGIREITIGSHSSSVARDLRDTGGALGKVYSDNTPELNNLTYSLTMCDPGDILLLTSDGITDNFDPVVGKLAMPACDLFPYMDTCLKNCDQSLYRCSCKCSKDSISCSATIINFTGKLELQPDERQQYAMKQIERLWHDIELKHSAEEEMSSKTTKLITISFPSSLELCQGLMNEVYVITKQKRLYLEKQHMKSEPSSESEQNPNIPNRQRVKLYAKSHSTVGTDEVLHKRGTKVRHQKSLDGTQYTRISSAYEPPIPPSLTLCPENQVIPKERCSFRQEMSSKKFFIPILTSPFPGKLDHATAVATEVGDWHDFSSINGYSPHYDD